jgi:hypothetical protein
MQREWERFNERIEISETGYGSYLRFKIRNIGGVTAHIMAVYLNDTTTSTFRDLVLANYICSNSSAYISPGTERWIYTTIPLTLGNNYDMRISTERGNLGIIPTFKSSSGEAPTGAQPMPFVFGFRYDDFQYLNDIGGWTAAWKLPSSYKPGGFRIYFTNTYESAVVLKATDTRLTFCLDDFQSVNKQYAYLSVDQVLEPKQGTYVVFGALQNKVDSGKHYYVFIEMFYVFQGSSDLMGTTVGILAIKTM